MKQITALCLILLLAALPASRAADKQEEHSMPELDLTKATIQGQLSALPTADDVLIEFFASWCPACRAFRPHFEKAAAFLLKHSKVHVFRLDCAADPDVCDKYKVAGYPTMYVGKAADVAAVAIDKLNKFDHGSFKRDSAGVVQYVAKHCNLDLVYVEEPAQAASTPGVPKAAAGNSSVAAARANSKTEKWTSTDIEAATRQLFTAITGFHPTENVHERRAALVLLLKFWSSGHPVPSCRDGSATLMKQLPQIWPEDAARDPWGLEGGAAAKLPTDVCALSSGSSATPAPASSSYVACKGSKPDTRGFTCGLWLLFHTTAVRLPDKDGGALLVSALKGFAQYFFQCEVCRKHFIQVASTPEAAAVRTRRDGVLWLWRAHNEVNARLQKVEEKYGHSSTGDPAYPKIQWPTVADCPLCRTPSVQQASSTSSPAAGQQEWNENEVYRFLAAWYGRQAVGSPTADSVAFRSTRSSRDGGSAIMQAALEADEEAQRGPLGLLSGKLGLLLLAALIVGVVLRWQLAGSSSGRRSLGLKGPGVLGHRPRTNHIKARYGAGAPFM